MTIFSFFSPPDTERTKNKRTNTVAGISFSLLAVPLNSFEEIFSKS